MQLRALLSFFVVGVLYPVWLLAGSADYICHRRTDIAHTSGRTESWLHVAQFATIAALLMPAVLLEITSTVLAIMSIVVVLHMAFSFVDVSFTIPRRHISSLEQHVHGLLNVLPIVAVCLLAILNWDLLVSASSTGSPLRLKDQPLPTSQSILLLGSFFLLAGLPVFEELFRTRRAHAFAA
jgi:hypothetical protein